MFVNTSRRDTRNAQDALDRILDGIESCRTAGLTARSDETFEAVNAHYVFVSQFAGKLSAHQYTQLGKRYWSDEALRTMIGRGNDVSVAYIRDAINMFAQLRLK